MDTLNRALEQAERHIQSLQNSTRPTLEGLQNERDQLDGNTAAIERRRFEARNRKPSPQQNNTPSKVIRLEYPSGSVNVNVRNGDENKLLRALKESGATAI